MFYKTKTYLIFLLTTFTLVTILLTFLFSFKTLNKEQIRDKNILVSSVMLPDLAISTEAMYVRHRSLSEIFSLFKESPSLIEYFPTTFVYNYSSSINNNPSKILNEK